MQAKNLSVVVYLVLVGGLAAATGFGVYQHRRAQTYREDLAEVMMQVGAGHALQPTVGPVSFQHGAPAGTNPVSAVTASADLAVLEAALAERDERIAALQIELSEREAELAARQAKAPTAEKRPERSSDRRRSWMTNLKETDPERYKAMMEQRKQFADQVKNAFAQKAEHMLKRDPSTMSAEEAEGYERMLALLDENWKLTEQMQVEDLPREERHEMRRTMWSNMRELTPLLQEERQREFQELGVSLGCNEEEAAEFSGYIGEIIEATSFTSMFSGMRGHGRGRGESTQSAPDSGTTVVK